jgi:hypothetical protein
MNDFCRDVQDCRFPVAFGFDLDGLYGKEDRCPPEKTVDRRLAGERKVLEMLPRPVSISIARSNWPRSYIPANIVDWVQDVALRLIRDVYG